MTKLRSNTGADVWSDFASSIGKGITAGLAILVVAIPSSVSSGRMNVSSLTQPSTPAATMATAGGFAHFGLEKPSRDVRHLADWVAGSRDTAGGAFVIVDKKNARVYVFDGEARLRGAAPVLLGSAIGDDSVPGIGSRAIADVLPRERTTPAGRFVAERGHNARGEDVVWVDYEGAVSIHRVLTTNAGERRLERLATEAADDNRVSYGCINVSVAFYEAFIRPIFVARKGLVYILPEVKSVQAVFGSYDVAKW